MRYQTYVLHLIDGTAIPMLMCGKVTQKNLIDNSPLFRKKAKNLIEISKIFWYNKDMNYLILPCEILMNK